MIQLSKEIMVYISALRKGGDLGEHWIWPAGKGLASTVLGSWQVLKDVSC